jgi:hypothetical protein
MMVALVFAIFSPGCDILRSYDGPAEYQEAGGDPSDGFPSFAERSLLVLTNMIRMAPQEYMQNYWEGDGSKENFMLAKNYTAVGPVYWLLELNQSARHHALDMAENNFFSHTSSNGDDFPTRVVGFISGLQRYGENIAAGQPSSLAVLNGLICDKLPPLTQCADDRSKHDGHRSNIMSKSFNLLGTGYIQKSNSDYERFWVQDFGGHPLSDLSPTIAGSHLVLDSKLAFFLNYFDDSNPQSVSLVLDGTTYSMTLDSGMGKAGTYAHFINPSSSACSFYYFEAISGDGASWRFPKEGHFGTFNVGDCQSDYQKSISP